MQRVNAMAALCLMLAACGGGRQMQTTQGGLEKRPERFGDRTVLVFEWSGGVAGFLRTTKIDANGSVQVGDRRAGRVYEMRLDAAAHAALMDTVAGVFKTSAGPFHSQVIDDFHLTMTYHPPGDRDSVIVEGDGTALPPLYQPLVRRLIEITNQAIAQGGSGVPETGDREAGSGNR